MRARARHCGTTSTRCRVIYAYAAARPIAVLPFTATTCSWRHWTPTSLQSIATRAKRSGNVELGAHDAGYSATGAPLIVGDLVITGVGGGEYGARGYIDAYEAATGKRRWRRHVVPALGEPGNDTWAGDSWKTGGGPSWATGSYDPKQNLLLWPTGNPSPDWDGDARLGDNLYTNSVLALKPESGEIVWHFSVHTPRCLGLRRNQWPGGGRPATRWRAETRDLAAESQWLHVHA